MTLQIILASQSPARLKLLAQVGIVPDQILPADIDERQKRGELPRKLAARLALGKANKIAATIEDGLIIGADTVVVAGRKVIDKALTDEDVKRSLQKLSNRRHQIYTSVCVVRKAAGETKISQKTVKSIIKFRQITPQELAYYCRLGEGIGKAGGYTITGYAECFVSMIIGSSSNIVGLPLSEAVNMLGSMGAYSYKERAASSNKA